MSLLLTDPLLQTCVVAIAITAGGAVATTYLWLQEKSERHLLFWALTFASAALRWSIHYAAETSVSLRAVEAIIASVTMLLGALASYEVLPAKPWKPRHVAWTLAAVLAAYVVAGVSLHRVIELGYAVYIGTLLFSIACLWGGYRYSGISGYAFAAAVFVCQAAFLATGLLTLGKNVGNHVGSPLITGALIGSILLLSYQRTRRKLQESEQSIRESEERSQILLRASPDGIWMHRMGTIEYANDALAKMLRYDDPAQLVGRQIFDFFPEHEREALRQRAARISATLGSTPLTETVLARRDGTTVEVETTASATPRRDGVRIIAVFRDVTQRRQSELARDQLAAIVESSNDAIISRSLEGTILTWNAAAERLFGYSAGEAIGRPMTLIIPRSEHGVVREHSIAMAQGGHIGAEEVQRVTKDGRLIDVTHTISPIKNASGETTAVAIIIRDITERKLAEKALRESENLFREFSENTPDIFWVRDAESARMLYVSPAWSRVTGHPAPRSREDFLKAVHPDDLERVLRDVRAMPHGGIDHEYRIVHRDGAVRWQRVQTFPLRDSEGRIYRIGGIGEDITERKEAEQRLLQMAHYDHLTDLPNRTLFDQSLRRAIDHARESGSIMGLLFVDLDRFKVVNDTLGHGAGDLLLREVSSRLVESVRVRDVVARLGGDEFALILPNLERAEDAGVVADKIIQSLSAPFQLLGQEVFVTASIGITLFPSDAADAGTLLRFADAAMYGAKEQGRNSYRFYTTELNARAVERLDLENSLRRAIERGEFLLHYQPKLDLASGRVMGVEALLRWERPGVGLVPPDNFIPVLEDTGLILPVGEWVIQEACRQIKAWRDEGLGDVSVAVNLSPRQFHQSDLGRVIGTTLREQGIAPALLEFELTETSLMSQAEQTVRILEDLGGLGIRFSVDDFGTGYSSLAYLKRFAIDTVKIDRTFVRDITTDPDDAAIALAVITMAHALGLRVVAEGVETEEQLGFLRSNACDEVQGYYLSRPLPAREISSLLRQPPWNSKPLPAGRKSNGFAVVQ